MSQFEWVEASASYVEWYGPPADEEIAEGTFHVLVTTADNNGLGIEGTKNEIIQLAERLLAVAHELTTEPVQTFK